MAMMTIDDSITPEPVPFYLHEETTRFVVGVDLGQSNDPTAVAVLAHSKGCLDRDGNAYVRHIRGDKSTDAERIDCRYLERLALGMPYPSVVDYVQHLLARPPLCGERSISGGEIIPPAKLVIDETGVGRAVGDIFESAELKPIRVSITAGSEVTCVGKDRWHVSKSVLISTVDAMLHTGELRFAAALTEAGAMRNELLDFRRHLGAAGRATYQARTGKHDDLVLAVAIGCWWLKKPPLTPRLILGGY